MSNLIITIISIALVAVATLMGAYYGGDIMSDATAKSKASEVTNKLQQVQAAVHLWQADHGQIVANNGNIADWVYALTGLTPTYLQNTVTPNTNYSYNIIELPQFSNHSLTSPDNNSIVLRTTSDGVITVGWEAYIDATVGPDDIIAKTCRAINKQFPPDPSLTMDTTYNLPTANYYNFAFGGGETASQVTFNTCFMVNGPPGKFFRFELKI